MGVKVSQSFTAAGNYVHTLAPGDEQLLLMLSGSFVSLRFKIEGNRGGNYFPIAVFSTTTSGPLNAPLTPDDGTNIAYTASIDTWTDIKVTITQITGGTATFDTISGNFFANPPPQKVIGAGGTIGVTGTVGLSSGSTGQVTTQNAFAVERVYDETARGLLEQILQEIKGLRLDMQVGLNFDAQQVESY